MVSSGREATRKAVNRKWDGNRNFHKKMLGRKRLGTHGYSRQPAFRQLDFTLVVIVIIATLRMVSVVS